MTQTMPTMSECSRCIMTGRPSTTIVVSTAVIITPISTTNIAKLR